ncbi:hypothetical protein B0H19DRAFT_11813 [Mycena capillaripes]|nr:hypothetical protein B0H19DRAFT_11813 [Mycena capillaripes]
MPGAFNQSTKAACSDSQTNHSEPPTRSGPGKVRKDGAARAAVAVCSNRQPVTRPVPNDSGCQQPCIQIHNDGRRGAVILCIALRRRRTGVGGCRSCGP